MGLLPSKVPVYRTDGRVNLLTMTSEGELTVTLVGLVHEKSIFLLRPATIPHVDN